MSEARWIASWYGSPCLVALEAGPVGGIARFPGAEMPFANVTLTSVIHLTLGGDRLRFRFSNLFGRVPLVIGSVYVAAHERAAVKEKVTFGGRVGVVVPPGSVMVSDEVKLATQDGSQLIISIYYPEEIPPTATASTYAAERNVLSSGAAGAEPGVESFGPWSEATYFLVGADVAGEGRGTIVGIGDSIILGGSTSWPAAPRVGSISRWPALLAHRLRRAGMRYGVVNAGVFGNRILRNGDEDNLDGRNLVFGPRVLSRFDRDVLGQPGVRYAILSCGINDIALEPSTSYAAMTMVDDLVAALTELTERSRRAGVTLYVTTLTPFERSDRYGPAGFYRPEKNDLRLRVNEWIRHSDALDGYIDFDLALADSRSPNRLDLDLDSGDHFHPNERGGMVLADSLDLSLFA